jgi:hypothetical protein
MAFLGIKYKGIQVSTNLGQYGITTPSASYQPEAAAFFAALEGAGGTLGPEVKTAWNSFVLREKDNSRYAKIKRLYPYLGGVINSAIIDAISLISPTNANFVDGDCDALIGLTPDGSTKYLWDLSQTDEIVNDINKSQLGIFNKGATTDTGVDKYYMGSIDSPSNEWFILRKFTVSTFGYIGQNIQSSSVNIGALSDASVIVARYSTTSLYTIIDGVASTEITTLNSNGANIYRPVYFGRGLNGAAGSFLSSQPSNGMFISQFDTLAETQAFEASYKTLLTEIGAI